MKNLTVREAFAEDCYDLAGRLRQSDLDELTAAGRSSALEALMEGFYISDKCYVCCADGEPIAMFGAWSTEAEPEVGLVWMLGTDEIEKNGTKIIRLSKIWLSKICEPYRVATNLIDARNITHLRWLEFLGCELLEEWPNFGPEKKMFYRFIYHPLVKSEALDARVRGDGSYQEDNPCVTL